MRQHIAEFIAIAADEPGEYWTKENFLVDLPEKWRFSFAVWDRGHLLAYAVISLKSAKHAHLHHFMVRAEFRSEGIGAAMVDEMESRARSANCTTLTLKVAAANERGRKFYESFGYRDQQIDGEYLVLRKTLLIEECQKNQP